MLNLLQPIASLAGQWMSNRAEKAKAKQALAVAKIEAQTKKVQSDADWEGQAMSASQDSIKDELWTVLFICLIVACFIPAAQPYISDGFRFLREDCPDWLSFGILASIAASFGLKSITKIKG
ncbi:hypothetical protein [uncultured Mediterranean phage uvMED]|jgi:hypothetical protein|nr:hypothetical protein [uncultured Mediterranean phage uvMED]|tara:strand:- start:155 stop:520 length:366 start_codon:yes stop_codon:yes gene_type:complete